MSTKRQVRLYTWIAGVAFVGFDIAIAAWGMSQRAETACISVPQATPVVRPAPATAFIVPEFVPVHGRWLIG